MEKKKQVRGEHKAIGTRIFLHLYIQLTLRQNITFMYVKQAITSRTTYSNYITFYDIA